MAIDTSKKTISHEYYCLINDVQLGPYDLVTLVSKISRDTLVWREGIDWEKASNVEELQKFFPEPQVVVVQAPVNYTTTQQSLSNNSASYSGLYRSQDEKVFTGFCGGLAHKYKVNVAVVRVIVFMSFSVYVGWFYFAGLFLPKYPTKNV
jgi:phage shock protein PspC (stress-responsive transcriptional regulator)